MPEIRDLRRLGGNCGGVDKVWNLGERSKARNLSSSKTMFMQTAA
jgi:hypothetical protein